MDDVLVDRHMFPRHTNKTDTGSEAILGGDQVTLYCGFDVGDFLPGCGHRSG